MIGPLFKLTAISLVVSALIGQLSECRPDVNSPVTGQKYRPLVMIHGLNMGYKDMQIMEYFAQQAFPGIITISIDAFNYNDSHITLTKQVPTFAGIVSYITEQLGDITLLGYSQGGLIARAVVEVANNNSHIHTFINLSGLAAGWNTPPIGMPDECAHSEPMYCDWYKDPAHEFRYLTMNKFLPYFDNQIKHENSNLWKDNFSKLKKLVMIGGPDDGEVKPWQSAMFGFYDKNMEIQPYDKQDYYDWYGLKTLHESGRIVQCLKHGVNHTEFLLNPDVFNDCIKPHLL